MHLSQSQGKRMRRAISLLSQISPVGSGARRAEHTHCSYSYVKRMVKRPDGHNRTAIVEPNTRSYISFEDSRYTLDL